MYIGIDIGGTTIIAGLVNESGDILVKKEIATGAKRGYEKVEEDILNVIKDILNESKDMGYDEVKSVGIGIPGLADIDGENVVYCTNLAWKNVPLGKNLRDKLNIPIYIDNDATVAGLAESVNGATRGYKNSIFLTIGTGVGGGIIIDNKVYSGGHGIGSEIGHMIVGENFYDCNCGNNGCLETFTSATAITKYAIKLINEGNEDTLLTKRTSGDLSHIDTRLVFDCAKEGDVVANKVVDRMVKYLSIGIANLINIMDPDIIAIGGGVSMAGDFLLNKIRSQVSTHVIYGEVGMAEIVRARLGNQAGLVGAAMLERYK